MPRLPRSLVHVMPTLLPMLILAALPVLAQPGPPRPPAPGLPGAPGPPGAPGAPDLTVAVPRHLRAVADHLSTATASDDVGRRALEEARTSMAAARAALGARALRTADELAASADDLLRVAGGPPRHGPSPDPTEVLPRVALVVSVLRTVPDERVRKLLVFASDVADESRRKAARSDGDAGREAARAEAIARAAAHVAIAADPSLGPIVPPPKPRHAPPPPERA